MLWEWPQLVGAANALSVSQIASRMRRQLGGLLPGFVSSCRGCGTIREGSVRAHRKADTLQIQMKETAFLAQHVKKLWLCRCDCELYRLWLCLFGFGLYLFEWLRSG